MQQAAPHSVYVVFKTHLDIGFTGYAADVIEQYIDQFIPASIALAQQLKGTSTPFIWTTGAWLIDTALERGTPEQRRKLDAAITDGLIVWHGLPFTPHFGLMDADLVRHGLQIARRLDQRYGRKTIAAKMTDVPGHTRAIVPLLAEAGIEFLHIGVNAASAVPDVPPLFRWVDRATNTDVVVAYHDSYGDMITFDGLDATLALMMTNDNHGPPTIEAVQEAYKRIAQDNPGATLQAGTLDDFAYALRAVRDQLPLIEDEIGDTWSHGLGTDPKKVSRQRRLLTLRTKLCTGENPPDATALKALNDALLLTAEHTWGMDEKTWLNDYTHYTPDQLRQVRQQKHFRAFAASWQEQRDYIEGMLKTIANTSLGQSAEEALTQALPQRLQKHVYRSTEDDTRIRSRYFEGVFDAETGAITKLVDRRSGHDWANQNHPLGRFWFQTFNETDYNRFYEQYNRGGSVTEVWARPDFTKPGIDASGAVSQTWLPRLQDIYERTSSDGQHYLLELTFPPEANLKYGAPAHVSIDVFFPDELDRIVFTLQWFDKSASRLPQALWFTVAPRLPSDSAWRLYKLGQWIDPTQVVSRGARSLHPVEVASAFKHATPVAALHSPDAPLVNIGKPSLLDFHNQLPAPDDNLHVNVYNNVWGTNFPMWFDEDARFTVTLDLLEAV